MKTKIYLLGLFCLIFLVQLVSATIVIQYGVDNVTWTNVSSINTGTQKALQVGLQSGTTYYFRANDTDRIGTPYQYLTQKTKEGGLDEMTLSLALGVFGTVLIGLGILLLLRKRGRDNDGD